ncbi:hypothetical protein DENSPDRAFT_671628 [Dentipellis sp. KUC8613]|nr:hypothetical protein DENSPDRAFT_671628 [Dentipellis sp. KUC8613]
MPESTVVPALVTSACVNVDVDVRLAAEPCPPNPPRRCWSPAGPSTRTTLRYCNIAICTQEWKDRCVGCVVEALVVCMSMSMSGLPASVIPSVRRVVRCSLLAALRCYHCHRRRLRARGRGPVVIVIVLRRAKKSRECAHAALPLSLSPSSSFCRPRLVVSMVSRTQNPVSRSPNPKYPASPRGITPRPSQPHLHRPAQTRPSHPPPRPPLLPTHTSTCPCPPSQSPFPPSAQRQLDPGWQTAHSSARPLRRPLRAHPSATCSSRTTRRRRRTAWRRRRAGAR